MEEENMIFLRSLNKWLFNNQPLSNLKSYHL